MRALATFLLFLLALSATGNAYDITTREGKVYKEIRLQEKTDLGIRIKYTDGYIFLDYSQIPTPDLWTFGFDEAKYEKAKNAPAKTTTTTIARPTPAAPASRPAGVQRLYVAPSPTPAASRPYTPSSSGASGQCGGYTQKGYRCKRMVKGGGNCYQH